MWGWQTIYGEEFYFWTPDLAGSRVNMSLFDPYSFAHCAGGALQFILLPFIVTLGDFEMFGLNLLLHFLFEILENTPCVIRFCRVATIDKMYTGDSVLNSIGDLLSFSITYYVCYLTDAVWETYAPIIVLFISLLTFLMLYIPAACKTRSIPCVPRTIVIKV